MKQIGKADTPLSEPTWTKRNGRALGMATVLVIALGGAVAAAPTASASIFDPGVCSRAQKTPTYFLAATDTQVPFKNVPVFKNGRGGKMIMSRSYSGTAQAQVTAGAEVEVGAVLAKAKATISASLTKSNTTQTTNTFERNIRPRWYGNAQYVSWGKQVRYVKYDRPTSCPQKRALASGTINFPALKEGWNYWETKT